MEAVRVLPVRPVLATLPPPMAGERVKLQVQERESRGSAESRRLRKQGLIPGVLYGRGKEPHADLASPSASCAAC